jgi:hypothetical protein
VVYGNKITRIIEYFKAGGGAREGVLPPKARGFIQKAGSFIQKAGRGVKQARHRFSVL